MTTGFGVSVVEELVESKDRTKALLRSWRPRDVRAALLAVHEPGSNGARYRELAHLLAEHGIATCAADLRAGAHRVMPIRRHLPDVRAMVSRVRQRDPSSPTFMCGHGTGAAIACHYAVRHEGELDGLICEGLVLEPPWRAAFRRKFPRLSDVLRGPGAARGGHVRKPLRDLALPLLLLHGSEDETASPSGSEALHRHVASTNKTLQVFEGYDHHLIDGPGHALVNDRIRQWIQTQLESGSSRHRIGIEYINE